MEMILSKDCEIGHVVQVNLDPTIGHEQKKTRPCIVINVHPKLELITVLPVTDATNKKGKVFVQIVDLKTAGLRKPSVIDTYQVRSLSKSRIVKKLGEVSDVKINECRKSLALIFEIDESHLV
jgi:mRNA interferase MazF